MSDQSILRISRELHEIQKNADLSITATCRDSDIRNVRALIIGPPDTPYEFGFFEFSVKFPPDYPGSSPSVHANTTNGGRCRFNPNIYAGGKVCLSILGTWRGQRGEEWSSAQGLESILISIQSLMSANPYENEPGFENAHNSEDKRCQKQYIEKIRHETLRISIIERLEEYLGIHVDGSVDDFPELEICTRSEYDVDPVLPPYEPFKDLCKMRFLWYYESYMTTIADGEDRIKAGQDFETMPFESMGNQMAGKFDYGRLRTRMMLIKDVLFRELDYWGQEGAVEVTKETTVAAMMERQFEQIKSVYREMAHVTLDMEMVDSNPFVWRLIYFGRPMTNLEGGMFKIKVYFSKRFPDELPRVVFETPLYHHRISADGVLCYFPKRPDEIRQHVEAIIEAIEEAEPSYDPRTLVNGDAFKLYWGSPEERKQYNRKMRRSVQRSMEE